jgi:hypothetical protein
MRPASRRCSCAGRSAPAPGRSPGGGRMTMKKGRLGKWTALIASSCGRGWPVGLLGEMNALSFSPRLSYARRNSSDVRTGRDRSARFLGHPLQALQVAAKQPIHADFVLFAEVHGVRGADALPAKARGKSTARFAVTMPFGTPGSSPTWPGRKRRSCCSARLGVATVTIATGSH